MIRDEDIEKARNLREKAEEKYRENLKSRDYIINNSKRESDVILHDLQVHQIELEMQNEELHRVHEELLLSKSRYYELYNLAPVGYLTLNDKGIITEVNLTFCSMMNRDRSMFVNIPFCHFIYKDDQDSFYFLSKSLFEDKKKQSCEIRLVKKDGSLVWFRLDSILSHDKFVKPQCKITITDISENKKAEEVTNRLLSEKETILKEVHHRVKNNMNTVSSLLLLQADMTSNSVVSVQLEEASGRVRCMNNLYDKLYSSSIFTELNIQDFVYPLIDEIFEINPGDPLVKRRIFLDNIILDSRVLAPLGIIINELITNSMKHAFINSEKPCISLNITKSGKVITVSYSDNGTGIPESVIFENSTGFGMQLIRNLTEQLGGTICIIRNKGAGIVLKFKG